MRAPTSVASRVAAGAAKAKTTKAKAAKPPHYTAAQNKSFAAWKKTHPFKKTTGGKASKARTTKRTLTLNGSHGENEVQLGRNKPYSVDEKPRLILDDYLPASGAEPAVVDFASEVVSWPMYGNDQIGDCTCATVGHQIQAWTRYTGAQVDVPEDDIIQLYSAVSGYDPSTGANDNGAAIQDVLTLWRQSGVPLAGHKILAFAQLQDLTKIKQALYLFGSVHLGINCPQSALDQFNADQPWDVVSGSPAAGGHAIPLQYAGTGTVPYQVVTWAKLEGMTQAFLDTYCEEAWIVITDDWLDQNGHTPEGLDLQQLGADLAAMTGDPNPFPAPPAPPAPVPVPPVPPAPVPAPPAPVPSPTVLQQIEQAAKQIIADVESLL